MIASIIPIVLCAVAVSASFHDLDPNTLQCDPTGQEFLLLPHFSECNKFFMCANGKEVEFSCASGTVFDFGNQICNWPQATKCVLRENPDELEESEESGDSDGDGGEEAEGESDGSGEGDIEGSGEGEGWYDPDITARSFVLPLDCRHPESAAKQLAYQGDCQRFWRCAGGVLEAVACSDGLFFNQRTQLCDFEANVRCIEATDDLENEFIVYK